MTLASRSHGSPLLSSNFLPVLGQARIVARWLLPWACVVILSASLARAAEQALIQYLPEQANVSGLLATPAPSAFGRQNWVTLTSVDALGSLTSFTCLTSPDRVSTDVLGERAEDLDSLVSALCMEMHAAGGVR
jgi:hypothetical protein